MILSTLLLACGLYVPFQDPDVSSPNRLAAVGAFAPDGERGEMYQHIEVMRNLLKRKLSHAPHTVNGLTTLPAGAPTNLYGAYYDANVTSFPGGQSPFGAMRYDGRSIPVDGVYLPGYGVVFMATVPWASGSTRSTTSKPANKALSEWERTEKEMKGEKIESAAPTESPSTTDTIIRLLADNGKNFKRLGDDERITVVLTVNPASTALTGSTADVPLFGAMGGLGAGGMQAAQNAYRGTLAGTSPFQPAGAPAQDYELLADMHLKQKKYDDALSAYAKAVARLEADTKANPSDEKQLRLAALLLKQSQALAATDQADAALLLLKRIAALQSRGDPVKPAQGAPSSKPANVKSGPGKIIISASKRLLRDVGAGSISIDEFRKGIQIEDLTQ